jgi:hypothetical protein
MRRDRDDETLPPEAALAFARFIRPAPLPWLCRTTSPTPSSPCSSGDPGVGKSLLAVDLAARISTCIPPGQTTRPVALPRPCPPHPTRRPPLKSQTPIRSS